MRAIAVIICAVVIPVAASQVESHPASYVLRISHETFSDYSCALLNTSGAFHLEFARGEDIRVFEGTTGPEEVRKVKQLLADPKLETLSQRRIEEPIVRGPTEKLQLTIYRRDHWQDLFFQSEESEEPLRSSLEPLVRWLENLHKLPHKEFSEDAGKQNCLPPREIALKKREPNSPPAESFTPGNWAIKSILSVPPLQVPHSTAPVPVQPLLRVYSLVITRSDAQRSCVLIAGNGRYRFEDHSQKMGRSVTTEVTSGKLSSEELGKLQVILDNPSLVKIQHHEPRGTQPVSMLGDMLNLSIQRPAGEQDIILSSSFGRQFGSFYGGDADTAIARDLTEFLKEHIENGGGTALDKAARNDCTELP